MAQLNGSAVILQDFIARTEGQCIDVDGAFGCQCVDLADAWANALGHPLPLVVGAKDFVARSDIPGWQWLDNASDNFPSPGDLVVWDQRIGPFGHIDLCIGPSDASAFTGLDQNWFNSNGVSGSPAARVTHGYYGVAGWLHPLSGGTSPMSTPSPPFDVVTNPGHWFDHPNGNQMGAFDAGLHLHVVEVVHDSGNGWDWARADLGSWWFVLNNSTGPADATIVAPPGPASPPSSALEARVAKLEARLNAAAAGLNA